MNANVKDTRRGRTPGTLEGKLPSESLDDFERRVGDDIPELTDEDMARARPLSDYPELAAALENTRIAMRGQRGQQKAPTKQRIGLRLDSAVVRHFRATGPGWQTRINEVLADYVKQQGK